MRGGLPLCIADKPDYNTHNRFATELGWSNGKIAIDDKVWTIAATGGKRESLSLCDEPQMNKYFSFLRLCVFSRKIIQAEIMVEA